MATIYRLVKSLVPQRIKLQYYIYKKSRRKGRPHLESLALRLLCDPEKNAIDVGANIGLVAYFLSKYSKSTHAFEINPVVADRLERARLPNTIIYRIGLSDSLQQARLRVPVSNFGLVFGLGTVESANGLDGSEVAEFDVSISTLDSFHIPDVGIIKIDVEGHELAVLRGAYETLKKDRPSLIVEIVERMNGNRFLQIVEYLSSFRYKCYRLSDKGFFEVAIATDEFGNNDYYFLQPEVADRIKTKLRMI